MTPNQVRSEVERFINALLENRVAIDVGPSLKLDAAGSTLITWSNETELSELFGVESTFDEYVITLNKRWFSAVLFDGAILQLSYTFTGNELKKHRLYYFPCPIRFTEEEVQRMTISELLEVLDTKEFRKRVRIEGPVRFDYDMAAGTGDHPAVHLTMSRSTSRIPVAYPMSVGHFARFVLSQFYPDIWESVGAFRAWACADWNRCLPEMEPHRLFVDWRRN